MFSTFISSSALPLLTGISVAGALGANDSDEKEAGAEDEAWLDRLPEFSTRTSQNILSATNSG